MLTIMIWRQNHFVFSCFFLLTCLNGAPMSKRFRPDDTLELPLTFAAWKKQARPQFAEELVAFREFGKRTQVVQTRACTFDGEPVQVTTYVNEFWTARQRAAHSLH